MKIDQTQLAALQGGYNHNPFALLGRHESKDGEVIRAFMPSAEQVSLDEFGPMTRIEGTDLFEAQLSEKQAAIVPHHYSLTWQEKSDGNTHTITSPYSFMPQLHNDDLHLFAEGKHHHAYRLLGARVHEVDGISGTLFSVWAPAAKRVSVVGQFNSWNGLRHPMRTRGGTGVWELFIPSVSQGDLYKYEILNRFDALVVKADPYGQAMTMRPDTASKVPLAALYSWDDEKWMKQREQWQWQHEPMSVYEVHLGSWQRHVDNSFLNYRDLGERIVKYVEEMGYTHIELMPIMEHPLDESWGYQVSGYYAPTARFGNGNDLRYLIDLCHQHNIGVILDWVPGHFPKDDFALARFTGEPLYEHADPKKGEHQDWGTLIFDYGRNEVKNFLLSNAVYWFEEFHIDGLRVDAVASMLYLDYSREDGQWIPNEYGGNENLEAITFLREMNEVVHQRFPGGLTIAEESTAWPMISRPTWMGGLGFSMKWNMGWMNDTLSYFEIDPIYRQYHHDKLTFSQIYSYSENFVLPFSHDEVVHLKSSMLQKMPGDTWQKFANLRLIYAWQYAHPGKKLLFMGGEIAQWSEWSATSQLDWPLLHYSNHQGIKSLLIDLNHLYRDEAALYANEFDHSGFQWIDCHDSAQSVLALIRHGNGEQLVCLFNFTPVPRENYRVGLPQEGVYREVINTDSSQYGGSNCGNDGIVHSEPVSWMGFENSVALTLPPLSALFLKINQP